MDKLAKVKAEIERLRKTNEVSEDKEYAQYELDVMGGYDIALDDMLSFINSLPEEPVSKLWHDASEETPTQGSNILMVRKEEKDTNYPPIAGCFHGTNSRLDGRNWGYYNGFCYNEIEPPVKWAYIDDILNLSNVQRTGKNLEELVSEDLGEYINELSKQFPEVSFAKLSRIAVRVAKWQKQQFEKNRLAHCDAQTEKEAEIESDFVMGIIEKEHRQPTFDDAIKYGMKKMKEQMMAKAIDGDITFDYYGDDDKTYGCIAHDSFCLEDFGLKDTDKVKMIIIKEG